MKKYKISFIIIFCIIILGLFQVNLNLNRQIYKSIMKDINSQENTYEKNINNYNLDNMVEVLSYPQKYDVKNGISIPKIRILFENKPFDFRVDTNKYEFFINNNSIVNLKSKMGNEFGDIKDNIHKMGKKIKNMMS